MSSLNFYTNCSEKELSQKLNTLYENYPTLMHHPAHHYLRIHKNKGIYSLCFTLGCTHTLWQFSFQTPGQITLTRKRSFYHYLIAITLLLIDIWCFGLLARTRLSAGLIFFLLLAVCEFLPCYLLEIVFAKKRIKRFMNEILLNDNFHIFQA